MVPLATTDLLNVIRAVDDVRLRGTRIEHVQLGITPVSSLGLGLAGEF